MEVLDLDSRKLHRLRKATVPSCPRHYIYKTTKKVADTKRDIRKICAELQAYHFEKATKFRTAGAQDGQANTRLR
jgi:hypothetical protein